MTELIHSQINIARRRMAKAKTEEKYNQALEDLLDLTQELSLYS
jgi:hypothetical protein